MLTKIHDFLKIRRKLLLGKDASIYITAANGITETRLSTTELALLDGLTASAAELNLTDGATYAVTDINNITNLVCSATGTAGSSATSASCSITFLNGAGTAVSTAIHGRAYITTTASATNFGVVSGITANAGAIANVTSGAFDFVTTNSGRIGINIVNGTSTNYVTFTAPTGLKILSPALVTS